MASADTVSLPPSDPVPPAEDDTTGDDSVAPAGAPASPPPPPDDDDDAQSVPDDSHRHDDEATADDSGSVAVSPGRASCAGSTASTTFSAMEKHQRSRRDEILLLKRSLPSRAELKAILDSHPQEGERLIRFCHGIQAKIAELEEDYQRSVKDLEQRKREQARGRAEERRRAHKAQVIERFMDKTLVTEDRQAERQRAEERRREEKLAAEYVKRQEAAEDRRQMEAERTRKLDEKMSSWNRAVATVAQNREAEATQAKQRRHGDDMKRAERKAQERRVKADELARARAAAAKLDHDTELHRQRHEQRLREKQEAATRLMRPVADPDASEKRHQHNVAAVRKDNERIVESDARLHQRLADTSTHVKESREKRLHRAKQRLAEQRAREADKVAEAERALGQRLQRHAERIEEQRQATEQRAKQKAAKLSDCKKVVDDRTEARFTNMSKKIMERTLRIGTTLGVDLPPVLPPSTMFTTAAAPRPEREYRTQRSGSAELTFQPSVQRKRYKQFERPQGPRAPPRSESAPPGGAASSSPGHSNSSGARKARTDNTEAPAFTGRCLLLAIDDLAPPASLLRTAASIVVSRIEDAAPDMPGQAMDIVCASSDEHTAPALVLIADCF